MGAGASASETRTQEEIDAWNTGERAAKIVAALAKHFEENPDSKAEWNKKKEELGPEKALDYLAAEMFKRIEANDESDLKGKFATAEEFGAALNAVKETAPVKEATAKMMTPKPTNPFNFATGLPDCCSSNPEAYKVVAELPGARLIEMTLPPGGKDDPHDHPPHSMYVLQGGKLAIDGVNEDGTVKGEPHEVELPTGAPPIMPAGAHQVSNVGDTEVKIIFLEPLPICKPCGAIDGQTPFEVTPDCYKILAEDENWITGMLTMEVGQEDGFHKHRDHVIYVLEGDGVTLYPSIEAKAEDKGASPPIKPGDYIPAPMAAAGGLFAAHSMKNSGTIPLKMMFFEMKQ